MGVDAWCAAPAIARRHLSPSVRAQRISIEENLPWTCCCTLPNMRSRTPSGSCLLRFVTYLALEALEHAASARSNAIVRRAGAAGPVAGALLGVVPQCGFSAMAATLYAGRVVTLGTLVAVFFSTSDEMLPMLVAERIDAGLLFKILGLKVLIALITGVAAYLVIRALRQNTRVHEVFAPYSALVRRDGVQTDVVDQMAEGGEDAGHICRLLEQDHCGCGHKHHHAGEHDHGSGVARASHVGEHAGDVRVVRELDSEHDHVHEGHGHEHSHGHDHDHAGGRFGIAGSIVMSAVSHTVQVSLFIFLVTFALVLVLETVGEDALTAFLSGNQLLAVFASALVGLVPAPLGERGDHAALSGRRAGLRAAHGGSARRLPV